MTGGMRVDRRLHTHLEPPRHHLSSASLVLGALAAVLRYSSFGLHMRAVTQNRRDGGRDGHPHRPGRRADLRPRLGHRRHRRRGAFADRQCQSQSRPDLYRQLLHGGGVRRRRSLWGTLLGACSLGIINKLLEPFAGAILGKILVLVFIILFIQRRPRGLFALKGRAAEG